MTLWVVRAGRHGEQEQAAVDNNVVCHGWNELPDYSGCTKEELRSLFKEAYPVAADKRVIPGRGQVWRFAHEIEPGDLVALPLKSQSEIIFGRVVGEYQYKKIAPNVMHIRKVEWLGRAPRAISSGPPELDERGAYGFSS